MFTIAKKVFIAREDGVSVSSVWKRVLGLSRVVVEGVELEEVAGGADDPVEQVVVASVRLHRRYAHRCPYCDVRCRVYDAGDGRRRWRGLDLGAVRAYLEADAPRVFCRAHGVVTAAVPWAEHGSRFTLDFADTVAWLTARADRSTVARLMRTAWKSVTAIVARTVERLSGKTDRLDGLKRVGIDEVSYRKGQRYLLRVTCLDTGRQVWAGVGANKTTLEAFFDALGPERAQRLRVVAADGAEWIHQVVTEHAPQAAICLDPYHVVAWANEALTELRRDLARDLKAAGRRDDAATLKGSRWVLIRNPDQLSPDQRGRLAAIAKDNKRLYTGYLIKEQIRQIFQAKGHKGIQLLAGVLSWCARTRSAPLVDLGRRLRRFRDLIINTCRHRASNAKAEAGNNNLRLLTRRAYGYHTPETLLAMSELTLGQLCPPLPGRT